MYIRVNNRIISSNVKLCNDFFSKFRGLMFSGRLNDDEALILNNSSDIHMLVVFQGIDVVWLDKSKNVIDKKEKNWGQKKGGALSTGNTKRILFPKESMTINLHLKSCPISVVI